MLNFNYGYRRQCGGFTESMRTIQYISQTEFSKLLPEYQFYGFDSRCNQFLFILRDMDKKFSIFHVKEPEEYLKRSWLFIEVKE